MEILKFLFKHGELVKQAKGLSTNILKYEWKKAGEMLNKSLMLIRCKKRSSREMLCLKMFSQAFLMVLVIAIT